MKSSSARSIIVVFLLSLTALPALAQYAKLRDFGSPTQGTGPHGSLVTDGTFMYGTTTNGGANGVGVIFKVRPTGADFSVIHHFDISDGSAPYAALTYDGAALYGTTYTGGAFLQGTIFKLNTDGSGFTTLFDFQYVATGGYPLTPLISDGAVLYGTTTQGGTTSNGTVFKINKDGTGHTKVFEFDGNNGASPQGNIVHDGTYIYGLTTSGGTNFSGTGYRVKTDGTGFETIMTCNGTTSGFSPTGGFFYDGTFLWGTTLGGGSNSRGTLFRLMPDGSGYQTVVNFNGTGNGASPKGTLVSDGTFLYGTTFQGGAGTGTLFRVLPNGTGFVKLANLVGDTSGPQPEGTMLVMGSALYGARSSGGSARVGNVFKIDNDGANQVDVYSFEIEGHDPVGELVSDGTFLYGVTNVGGHYDDGTIYKIKPDGTGFQRILDLEESSTGSRPLSGLCLVGSTLYGMTSQGGANSSGAAYRIDTDGTDVSKLLDFDVTNNGNYPQGGFVYDGTFLYGMTSNGGANSGGTIFKILPNGTGYTKLRDLASGQNPNGTLILEGGALYGTTYGGGDFGFGVVFTILPDGNNYTELVSFDYANGSQPHGSLYSDGTFLYGTTYLGGSNGVGTIFKVKKDGSVFQSMMDFKDGDATTSTGAYSSGSFISDGTYLYAVASGRGVDDKGTLFRIKPDGTGFDKLLDFNDGSLAGGRLFSDGTFLYGVAYGGGKYSHGILFKRSLADYVSITNFSPKEGAPGTYVIIKGNDFNPVASLNTAKFNGEAATVISAALDSIVAMVPDGATDGPISVTSGGTDTSIEDFIVTSDAEMFNGTVQTCDAFFTGVDGSGDLVETFIPGIAGGKLKITFTDMDIEDELLVYDGPDETSPLVATLSQADTDFEYTSTAPGGELTFRYNWQDASSQWEADIECAGTGVIMDITDEPEDIEVCEGITAGFSTLASGAPNISYQWQFSDDGIVWNDIVGDGGVHYSITTTAVLIVNTTAGFGAGHYRCRVNGDGAPEVITNIAALTLIAAPAPPVGGGVPAPACGPVVVTLDVSGGTDGQYRWYDGTTLISGAVNHTFTTPSLTASKNYSASITDGQCESTRTVFAISVKQCTPPVVTTVQSVTTVNGVLTIDLTSLIADAENDLDPSTLKVVGQPASGATTTISGLTLTINYAGTNFTGTDVVSIEVCDLEGLCAVQQFNIDVAGDVVVYNAVSPNGDGKNDYLLLEFIDALPSTRTNTVKIYSRWGDEVFSISNYNNVDRLFNGFNKNGNKLPSGTYFYKVTFPAGGHEELSGYLQLKH